MWHNWVAVGVCAAGAFNSFIEGNTGAGFIQLFLSLVNLFFAKFVGGNKS